MKEHEIVSALQRSAGFTEALAAERAVLAILRILGSRPQAGDSPDLAAQLPPTLATALPEQIDEFYHRLAEAEHCDQPTAWQHARAVAAVLKSVVSPGELNDVLAQLPADYDDLFATSGPVH